MPPTSKAQLLLLEDSIGSIGNESKSTCIPTNESQVKELPCFDVMKGQRVAHTILTCFKDIFRIRRIFSANV